MALFNTLKQILTPYANKINLHTEEIEALQSNIDRITDGDGEVAISGELLTGLYPYDVRLDSSANAKTAVFPVEPYEKYYISWGAACNRYRVAFGDTPVAQAVAGTTIYGYIDAASLSHDHLSATNTDHTYMYVYIGTASSAATINDISVVRSASVVEDLKEEIQEEIVRLQDGEVVMEGTVITGLYPKTTEFGDTGDAKTKTVVFSVEPYKIYRVTWGSRCTKHRVCFGDTPVGEIANGTPVYEYTDLDGTTLSLDRFKAVNTNHQYMYVYIGSFATDPTEEDYEAVKQIKIESVDEKIRQLESTNTFLFKLGYAAKSGGGVDFTYDETTDKFHVYTETVVTNFSQAWKNIRSSVNDLHALGFDNGKTYNVYFKKSGVGSDSVTIWIRFCINGNYYGDTITLPNGGLFTIPNDAEGAVVRIAARENGVTLDCYCSIRIETYMSNEVLQERVLDSEDRIDKVEDHIYSDLIDVNYPGLWMSTDLNHRGRGDGSQDAKSFFYHSNVSLRPSVKYLDVNEDTRIHLLGLDAAYKPLSNPFIFRYGDTEHTSPINNGYRVDLDSVRKANPSAEYILAACASVKNLQRNLLVDSEIETESPAYSSSTVYSGYYYPSEYALPYFSQEGCVFTLTAEYEIIGNAVESGAQIYGQINNTALAAVSNGYGSSCNEDIYAGNYVGIYKRSCKLSAAQASAENKRIRFGLKNSPTPGTVLKIRRIKFEFGMVSTGWTPAPEDTGETFVEPVITPLTAQYAADHIKMLALPSYRWWGNEDDYKITPYDWTNAYRTSSTYRITSGSDNALSYLVIPRINMRTGDYIEAFLPDGYQSLCWTQTNDYAEDLYFPSYDGPYTEKQAIYRAYRDCTMCFHVRTTPDLTPINPVTCPVEVYIHRRKDVSRVIDRNLLLQSRFSEVGGTPLTLVHYSDNHGSTYGIEELERYYCENFNYIDDFLNTGDTVYSYYGFSIDGDPAPDYDETVTYSVGDYTVNSGRLYKCTASTSGAFDSTKWTKLGEFSSNEISAGRLYDSLKRYVNSDLAKRSLFVLGNHDTALADYRTATSTLVTTDTWHLLKQSDAYNSYFAPFVQDWGVTMGSATNACYWYKDYSAAKIRLIGVDMAYWDSTEATWLTNTLAGARTNGYSVILASHQRFGPCTYNANVSFQTLASLSNTGEYADSKGYSYGLYTNGDAIPILTQYADIIICHLCGHVHADTFGYYDNVDILVIGINQAAGAKDPHSEVRIRSMENTWLFNAITFNTTAKTIKIVRIGQDTDETLRRKKTLVYNYDTKTIISNN